MAFRLLFLVTGIHLAVVVTDAEAPAPTPPHHTLPAADRMLPLCSTILSGVPRHQWLVLAEAVQLVQRHRRHRLGLLQQQAADDDPAAASGTGGGGTGSDLLHPLQPRLSLLGLPATAARIQTIAACLSGRLVPALYPKRPAVSFMLQYFKRPHVIERLVTSLKEACASAGLDCELLANGKSQYLPLLPCCVCWGGYAVGRGAG